MAGQDYRKIIPAGGTLNVSGVGGDYIYLKFADRDIDVIVTGGRSGQSRVTMQVGDTYRPGAFDGIEIQNPDAVNDAQVVFTVGEGDYRTQTIKGQLNVVPSVIKADGTVKADDRFYVDLNVSPSQQFTTLNVDAGEIITRQLLYTEDHSSDEPFAGPLGNSVLIGRNNVNGGNVEIASFTIDGELQEIRTLSLSGTMIYANWKDITPIDDEYFFLAGRMDTDSDSLDRWGVVLCRWFGGSVVMVGSLPLYESAEQLAAESDGWITGCGVHYDADTATCYLIHRSVNDTNSYTLHTLAYNQGLQTLSLQSKADTNPSGISTCNVQSLGRIDGELLAVMKRGNSNAQQVIRLSDGVEVWSTTLSPLTSFQARTSIFQVGSKAYTVEGTLSGNVSVYLAERWPKTTTYNFAGRVLDSAEACFDGLFKPVPPGFTEAAVTAVNVGGHRFRLSGEIIKASLELFFGGEVVPEYLDAIYGIEIQDTASLPRWYKQYSGNESFQRAGQADDYSVLVPGTLRLFVDSTFWSLKV